MPRWRGFGGARAPLGQWLRTLVRLVVAAAVAALVVTALGFPDEPAAWAMVAVAVVVGDTTGQSVAASWNRMQGSVVGCLSGAVVQISIPMVAVPIRVAIAMALCLSVCRLLRVGSGWRLGVALAGFFIFVPGAQEWEMVGWRLSATLLGITIALLAVMFVAPDTAATRLRDGIRAVLAAIASSVDADVESWLGGGGGDRAVAVPDVSGLRPLVVDRRHEISRRAPMPDAVSAMLDGVDLAAAGVQRLNRYGGEASEAGLHTHIADDLRAAAIRIATACAVTSRALTDPSAHRDALADARAGLDTVEADLEAAIERLRALGVTPTARAAELTRLFGVINALGLVAMGLVRAIDALR